MLPRRMVSAAGLILVGASLIKTDSQACGPFFPSRLTTGGDASLLWAPVADFRREVERLAPKGPARWKAVPAESSQMLPDPYAQQTAQAEEADLREALQRSHAAPGQAEKLVAAYAELRRHLGQDSDAGSCGAEKDKKIAPPGPTSAFRGPAGLPAEFAAYLEGADRFYREDLEGARAAWRKILTMPAGERHYRSTWAAYMLGKSYLARDSARAVEYFEQVRKLASEGFADRLGLASSSLGWQARAELDRVRYEPAAALYLQQLATGDNTAAMSLRCVAVLIAKEKGDTLKRAARDESTRRLMTAYLLSNRGPRQSISSDESQDPELLSRWVTAVETAQVKDAAGADRLAWLAYQSGNMKLAARWLDQADKTSPVTQWIQAKLLLRRGKTDEAAQHLASATRAFPVNEEWSHLVDEAGEADPFYEFRPSSRTLAELGILRLHRGQYIDSLDALVRSGFWLDAAYVAERVLTVDELKQYVDRNWPALPPAAKTATEPTVETEEEMFSNVFDLRTTTNCLRSLLGRRLCRLGRYQQARGYFEKELQATVDLYARYLREGRDKKRSAEKRADSLWVAAQLLREQGADLVGAELDPDWISLGGDFEMDTAWNYRTGPRAGPLTQAGPDERARVQDSEPKPRHRWHYRYIAAELAWQAARLMPDDADETALVLAEAGSWIKVSSPKEADIFYKALVRRCGHTKLGQEAAQLHWFPDLDP